ncbi:GFA family protein [Paraglaciecola aestuariivivens]
MAETKTVYGSCLCKKVNITAKDVTLHVDACHCSTCRKWSGGPLLALDCKTQVSFTDSTFIKVYESSEWAERGFCSHCGTHLFYRLKQNQQYIMPVALFDIEQGLTFTTQIFIEEKPDYYTFANQTKMMTGEQVFSAFSQT